MVGNFSHGFNKAISTTTKGISTLGNVMVAGVTGGFIGNDSSEADGELRKAELDKMTPEELDVHEKTRHAYAMLNNFAHIWKAKRHAKQLRREKLIRIRVERGESTEDVEQDLERLDEDVALMREEEIQREKENLVMHAIGISRVGRTSPFAPLPPYAAMSPQSSFYFTNAPLTNVPRSLQFLEKFQKEEQKEAKEVAVEGIKLAKEVENLELDHALAEMSKEQLITSIKNIKSSFDSLLRMHMGAMEQAGAIYEEIDKIRSNSTSAITTLGIASTPTSKKSNLR